MSYRAEETAKISGPVHFGEDVYVGHYTLIAATAPDGGITIGDRTAIAGLCWIGDQDHEMSLEGDIHALGVVKPVTIGARCWIGAGSKILKGVTLGDDVVVGAGSVVNRSFPARCVIAGNPARFVKWRE